MGKGTKRKVHLPPGDLGTPERARQLGGVTIEDRTVTAGGRVVGTGARAHVECLADWYLRRGLINDRQHTAAIKLRVLHFIANASPQVTARYGERMPGSGEGIAEARVRAESEVREALRRVGQRLSGTLVNVALYDTWPRGTGETGKLRDALDILSNWWRLPDEAAKAA